MKNLKEESKMKELLSYLHAALAVEWKIKQM